jgi:cholest-4-en-3-one 26-monooxygenase
MTIDERLTSPAFFAEGDFRALFARMRREDPVHWTECASGPGFWSIFRHADLSRILDEPQRFSSEREGVMPIMGAELDEVAKEGFGVGENVLVVDPPRHTAFRKVIAGPFLPKALRDGEARTRRLVAEIFDELPESGECDLVEDLGAKIPMAVICDIMKIPREDWDDVLGWGRMAIGGTDPEFQQGGGAVETIRTGFRQVREYNARLAEERRGCPYADPLTSLANATFDGRPLTRSEIAYNGQQVMLAGFETTRNAFSGGVLALLEHPKQMEKLRADPKIVRYAVEEVVRWTDPVISLMRVATEDVEIGGKPIRAGDRIVLWFASANRDETVFDRPDEFDVTRHPNPHVGFGAGPHFCLGAPLARIELHAALEELLARYEGIEIVGAVERVQSNFVGGLKRLPVRLKKRAVPLERRTESALASDGCRATGAG